MTDSIFTKKKVTASLLALTLVACGKPSEMADGSGQNSARRGTEGGGSTSSGVVSGATPAGMEHQLPPRETSTKSGPGTPNPGPGGSGMTGSTAGGTGAGGSETPTMPEAPKSSASGATTHGDSGIVNAPGMAAGPNGRRGLGDSSSATSR